MGSKKRVDKRAPHELIAIDLLDSDEETHGPVIPKESQEVFKVIKRD